MIIISFTKIGKTTFSKNHRNYIDLESQIPDTNFNVINYPEVYAELALSLSRQGFNVFVPMHPQVLEWIGTHNDTNELVVLCHPSVKLKDEWTDRIFSDFKETVLKKAPVASVVDNVKKMFEPGFNKMIAIAEKHGFRRIEITSMDYDLGKLLSVFDKELA